MDITETPSPTKHRSVPTLNGHAVVIGASMAGLLAARVLSDHFQRVTLIERDRLPTDAEDRKGVPQGRHFHTLLVRGQQIIARLFPDLMPELNRTGIESVDIPGDVLWFQEGGYKARFQSGIAITCMSRALLEYQVRRRVLAISNLTCLDGHDVQGLVADAEGTRITGVTIKQRAEGSHEEPLAADLIVDATGRGSRSPKWLEALGYPKPPESVVDIDLGYTTRVFRRDPKLLPNAKGIFVTPTPPHGKRGGSLFPIEDGRWMVTLAGWLGDHAPADEHGFLAYAKSLARPDIYDVIARAEPLSDCITHGFPSNLRRHYERMKRFPRGYLVMGDAMCSFNPVYAQGMSISAMEAEALDRCLEEAREHNNLHDLAGRYFKSAAKAIENPWLMAAGEDHRFPGAAGPKPAGTDLVNRYVSQIHRSTFHDHETARALFRVMALTHPPTTLFSPKVALRVLWSRLTHRQTHAPESNFAEKKAS